jgi:Fic family protein
VQEDVLPRFSTRRQENAQLLMRHLYQNPVVSIKEVAELLNIKVNTAAALVGDFVKYGVLNELTGGRRNRLFHFIDYTTIFKSKS